MKKRACTYLTSESLPLAAFIEQRVHKSHKHNPTCCVCAQTLIVSFKRKHMLGEEIDRLDRLLDFCLVHTILLFRDIHFRYTTALMGIKKIIVKPLYVGIFSVEYFYYIFHLKVFSYFSSKWLSASSTCMLPMNLIIITKCKNILDIALFSFILFSNCWTNNISSLASQSKILQIKLLSFIQCIITCI
jgi:hypothetical protein